MPFIMDGDMEVDELFGDSAAMDTAMDTAMDMTLPTPLKGLAQRLHEVHTSGCTQSVVIHAKIVEHQLTSKQADCLLQNGMYCIRLTGRNVR